MVVQVNMNGLGHDQPHIPVDAPVEGEVRPQGRDGFVVRIGHPDHEQVIFPWFQQWGQVEAKGGIAAEVFAYLLAIYMHRRFLIGPFKMEVHLLVFPSRRHPQHPGVPAGSPIIAFFIIQAILSVPGMGEVDPGPIFRIGEGGRRADFTLVKKPAGVDGLVDALGGNRAMHEQQGAYREEISDSHGELAH